MGLDVYMVAAHNKEELKKEDFWSKLIDMRDMESYAWDKPAELYYARKFWDLYTPIAHHFGLENGEWVEVDKTELENILDIACHNEDYFGSFDTVPAICRIIYNYDLLRENGLQVFFSGNF